MSVYDNEPDPDAEPPEPVSAREWAVWAGVGLVAVIVFVTGIVWAPGGGFVS